MQPRPGKGRGYERHGFNIRKHEYETTEGFEKQEIQPPSKIRTFAIGILQHPRGEEIEPANNLDRCSIGEPRVTDEFSVMRTHIDWITFTMPMIYGDETDEAYALAVQAGFMDMFEADLVRSVFGGIWTKQERSRAPYKDTWMDEQRGISLYASPNLIHCCIEISGQGCERLIAKGEIKAVLEKCAQRVTRIDIASDIDTETKPDEFVAITKHERMRADGTQNSETGQTCYVGSKKSDRYARVYRYYKPHPRSHLLRIEHVFRRKYAKSVVQAILDTSLERTAKAAGEAFGWAHKDWQPEAIESADISITQAERGGGKTIAWLVRSVAPAIKRLITDGTIRDPDVFFDTYFRPEKAIDA